MPKVIQVPFSDEEYDKFLEEKAKANASDSTDAQFIKDVILPANDFRRWFPELLQRVDALENGTAFNIRAVMATDWVNIPKGIRLALGRVFFQHVDANKVENVTATQMDSAKTQWYVKGENHEPTS